MYQILSANINSDM